MSPHAFIVVARLNAPLQPLDRAVFEEPLAAFLSETGLGAIVGGGTQLGDDCIAFCEIEVALRSREDSPALIAQLEAMGAPKGSLLMLADGSGQTPFGTREGLVVRLNGADLPDEVYETSDLDHVIDELGRAVAPDGLYMTYWEGASHTSLFFFGPSFAAMKAVMTPFLETYPLCQQCLVEQVA
jgi:hypothetical protein